MQEKALKKKYRNRKICETEKKNSRDKSNNINNIKCKWLNNPIK